MTEIPKDPICEETHPHGASYRLIEGKCPWHEWEITPAEGAAAWDGLDPWLHPKAWRLEKAKRQYARKLGVPRSEIFAVLPEPTKDALDHERKDRA